MKRMLLALVMETLTARYLTACSDVIWVNDGPATDPSASESDSQTPATDSAEPFDTVDFVCPANDTESAPSGARPVNFIIAQDTSAGMEDETLAMQSLINEFSVRLKALGMDPRIVLISADGSAKNGICVNAPLGGGSCPDDSNPPDYLHINQAVGSKDALSKILSTHDLWKDAVYLGELTAFLALSDDDSEQTADAFQTESASLVPSVEPYVFYAIAASSTKADACAISAESACCLYAVKEGAVYQSLALATEGLFEDLCLQDMKSALSRIALNAAEKTCARGNVIQ